MAIEILDPDSQIPEPRNKRALYFTEATRDLFRKQLANVAKQGNHRLFFEPENGRACTLGLTSAHQVVSVNADGALLSNSHALHNLSPDVGSLNVGQWYEMAIDPSSNIILWAEAITPPWVRSGHSPQTYDINPETLPSLSPTQAADLFSSVQRQPHIPFRYPTDGCWVRAHEMCRLIEFFFGKNPKDIVAKVWHFAERSYFVKTDDNPYCKVEWTYHVAPLIKVGELLMVIDPSLFTKPVEVAEWLREQGNPPARTAFTCWNAYKPYSIGAGTFSREMPGESETELQYHQILLIAMIFCHGPIPYKC